MFFRKKTDKLANNIDKQKREAGKVRKFVLIFSLVGVLIIGGAALWGYLSVKSALEPADPSNTELIEVEIPTGAGASTISQILEDNGIVDSARVYKYYLKFNNYSDFQAGVYELSPSMTLEEVSEKIQSVGAAPVKLKITIPEGKNLEEIATIMAEKTGTTQQAVMSELNDPAFVQRMMDEFPELLTAEILDPAIRYPLEGYLFPATYTFAVEQPTVEEMTTQMLAKTQTVLSTYEEQMGDVWTPHELLTLASVVEEESNDKTERDKVAAVFMNRTEIGMKWQTDTSVNYALDEPKAHLSTDDLKVESPYNTYLYDDMPGPIACAGEASIQAVLAPAETNDLYFLTKPDGYTVFAETFDEHVDNKEKYMK